MLSNKKVIKLKKPNSVNQIIYKNSKEKGDLYEKYIYYHLLESNKYKNVWMWKNVPEYELLKSGIMDNWNNARLIRKKENIDNGDDNRLPDFATDLFSVENNENNDNNETNTNKYSIIQCKNYDETKKLRPEHLGTFYFMMYRYSNFVNGLVFHTNDLCENLINHTHTNDNIKYNKVNMDNKKIELYNLHTENEINKDKDNDKINNKKLKPFQYQIDAYEALKGKHRTVLQMACGTGKTLVSILLAKDYKQNIIISPLKSYCEQNMERFQSQMPKSYAMLIIDSDNDGRNIDNITEFIKKNPKICIFVTYKSIDIINTLMNNKLFNNYFIIIDEFHNISYQDLENPELKVDEEDFEDDDIEDDDIEDDDIEDDNSEVDDYNYDSEEDIEAIEEIESETRELEGLKPSQRELEGLKPSQRELEAIQPSETKEPSQMYKLLHSDSRIMFMSATPRLFGEDLDGTDDNEIDTEIDNDIFGNIDYTFSMSDAIDQNRICDYKIFVPTLHIAKETGIELIYNEANLKDYDKELIIKARYVIKGMMEMGSRKCIIYLQNQNECREMTKIINEQCKNYFAITHSCNYIIFSDLRDERKLKLKQFTDFDGYSFICSVDILNECIDIPKCDSIFIAYPSKSKIRNIQRLCRANRKDKENPNKIANIFLWCQEYKDDLVDFISHIKEYDCKFSFSKINRLNVTNQGKTLMMPEIEAGESKELENIVVGFRGVNGWMEKYEEVIKFFDTEKKRPRSDLTDKNQKKLSAWLRGNTNDYKNKKSNVFNKKYVKLWEDLVLKYECYFPNLNLEEKWYVMFDKVKKYMITTNRKPYNQSLESQEKEYGLWLTKELNSFKLKIHLMKNDNIYKVFSEFIIINKELFKNNEEKWISQYLLIIDFLTKNKKLPKYNLSDESYLRSWLRIQFKRSKNNTGSFIFPKVKELWTKLLIDFPIILDINKGWQEEWIEKTNNLYNFININKKMPDTKSNNKIEKQLSSWYYGQNNNYKKNKILLNSEKITKLWEEFIEKIKIYIPEDDIENWNKNYNDVLVFIENYNRRPSKESKDNTEYKLGRWVTNQFGYYKNNTYQFKNIDLKEKFKNMMLKYPKLFTDREEYNIQTWFDNLELIKDYVLINNKRPISLKNSSGLDLNTWLGKQIKYMKEKEYMLSRDNIYLAFNEFYIKYKNILFETLEEQWGIKLNNLKNYLDTENKKPSKESKNNIEKTLGNWLAGQKSNYKEKIGTVYNNLEIKNIYEEFLNDEKYKKYL